MKAMQTDRREFILSAVAAGGAAMLGGCKCPFGGCGERVPYGDTIGDRLWMWGHHADSFASMKGDPKEHYNLPFDRRIDMAAACREMDIPGCFVVRWRNLPTKAELPEYMKQFANTKRVGFSITDQAPESFDEKIRLGLELADRMPNLTSFVMDDFFSYNGYGSSPERIRELRHELLSRGMRLGIVLYADQNGVKAEFKESLDLCDEITFWFWNGKNVDTIEEQVGKLKDLVGAEKPILLGQYMYNFGGRKAMSGSDMETQLAATSRLLSQKAIDGVIFHCTPLVDMNLDAVNVSRAWIEASSSRRWGVRHNVGLGC